MSGCRRLCVLPMHCASLPRASTGIGIRWARAGTYDCADRNPRLNMSIPFRICSYSTSYGWKQSFIFLISTGRMLTNRFTSLYSNSLHFRSTASAWERPQCSRINCFNCCCCSCFVRTAGFCFFAADNGSRERGLFCAADTLSLGLPDRADIVGFCLFWGFLFFFFFFFFFGLPTDSVPFSVPLLPLVLVARCARSSHRLSAKRASDRTDALSFFPGLSRP